MGPANHDSRRSSGPANAGKATCGKMKRRRRSVRVAGLPARRPGLPSKTGERNGLDKTARLEAREPVKLSERRGGQPGETGQAYERSGETLDSGRQREQFRAEGGDGSGISL